VNFTKTKLVKMKKAYTLIAIVCLVAGMLSSCKKGGTSSPPSTRLSILTKGAWVLQDWQKKNSSGVWESEHDSFLTHDRITFHSDHTYTVEGRSDIGQWQSDDALTQLTIGDGTPEHGSYTVITITDSSLQLELNVNGELWVYSR